MLKPRVIETNEGIQNEVTVAQFDSFARIMRDKGLQGVDSMLATGITKGNILEIGPGPGYVGLELVKKLPGSALTGCEISPAMIKTAEKNAADYGIHAKYIKGNAMDMPFGDSEFDAVVSNGSLHEWEDPRRIFNEIHRVLRPGGRYCITDLRRDIGFIKRSVGYASAKPKELRPGFISSLNAAYTADEITAILRDSKLKNAIVKNDFMSLCIYGQT